MRYYQAAVSSGRLTQALGASKMVEANHVVAALRVSGKDLIPHEVSKLLGHEPTSCKRVGVNVVWVLDAPEAALQDFDEQVSLLLSKLTPNLQAWHSLRDRFELDIYCGWFMGKSNEGATVSPETMRALSERGIELGLELYAPSNGA